MLHIITGEINSGKTTRMLSIYNACREGNGFYNRKVYMDNNYAGQRIVKLSTGEYKPFSFKERYIPEDWDEIYRYFDYSFSKAGIEFAEQIAGEIIKNNTAPVFIDEIGPLELDEKGFYNIFKLILAGCKDIYVVIREECVESVVEKFNIKEYQII